ncbi:MAG: AAA family ATPase [Hyphomicrobiaceae bacterium]
MQIRAIRVQECRRFTSPVALENLSGGLDLLVGPNEAGKSTLLQAMRTVFTHKHTSNHAAVRNLRPYDGGAPMIEVDFAISDHAFRLRKRYLGERAAELRNVSTGEITRGADVDTALENLLGNGRLGGQSALLWLDQGSLVTTPVEMPPESHDLLLSAVSAEIENAAGGDILRTIGTQVKRLLRQYVTRERRAMTGDFLKAEKRLHGAQAALDLAHQQVAAEEAQMEELGRIALDAAALREPERIAQRQRRLDTLVTRLHEAREGVRRRDAAAIALEQARSRNERAQQALENLHAAKKLAEDLASQAGTQRATTGALEKDLEAAGSARAEAEKHHQQHLSDLARDRALVETARTYETWRALAGRLSQAQALKDELEAIDAERAGLPTSDRIVVDAQRLASKIASQQQALEAQAPAIDITYTPEGQGRISRGGAPVPDGTRIIADTRVELDIAGIGTISVTPRAPTHATLNADLAADRASLATLLAEANAATPEDLETRREQARQLEARRAEASAQLKTLAPDGLDRIAAEAHTAEAEYAARSNGLIPEKSASELANGLVPRERETEKRAALVDAAKAECNRIAQQHAAALAKSELFEKQLATLAETSPSEAEYTRIESEQRQEAEAASTAYDQAIRLHDTLAADVPPPDELEDLAGEDQKIRSDIEQDEKRLAGLDQRRSHIEGGLEQMRQEDRPARLDELTADRDAARRRFDDISEEVAALQLLDSEIEAEAQALRAEYQQPVTERLSPYLHLVFPDGQITLDDKLQAAHLARANTTEKLQDLSAGTREQIAVLTRLGFARLLADRGMSWPLVLDDALIHSDDQRIAAMHTALEQAATHHQVILLTCRTQTFERLPGNRVSLSPWQPA